MSTTAQASCQICGAPRPAGAGSDVPCPTCGTTNMASMLGDVGGGVSPGANVLGDDLFSKAPPKREPPPEPTLQERAIDIIKASGFWGIIGLVVGAVPLALLAAVIDVEMFSSLEVSRRMMVLGGFGALVGSLLGIIWGAVRVEELSTPQSIGFGVIIGIPLSAVYRFFLFPNDLLPESGLFHSIVMGIFGGVICGAIVSWLNRDY